jgi:hypothetical protein
MGSVRDEVSEILDRTTLASALTPGVQPLLAEDEAVRAEPAGG